MAYVRKDIIMRQIISKITSAVLLLSMAIVFAGCSGARTSDETTATTRPYEYYLLLDREISEYNSVYLSLIHI